MVKQKSKFTKRRKCEIFKLLTIHEKNIHTSLLFSKFPPLFTIHLPIFRETTFESWQYKLWCTITKGQLKIHFAFQAIGTTLSLHQIAFYSADDSGCEPTTIWLCVPVGVFRTVMLKTMLKFGRKPKSDRDWIKGNIKRKTKLFF